MMNRRYLVLGAVFALTLAASVWDLPWQYRDAKANADAGVPARSLARPRTAVPQAPAPAATGAARMRHTKANAFAVHSWLPPAVKRPPPPPPPPPRAPKLPFAYLGKMQDGAAVTAFVSQGERSHVLHAGDTLPGYRVDSITPTDMTFVYLPLNEKQRLTFGSAN